MDATELRKQRLTEILVVPNSYIQDGLATIHNNEFMEDKVFVDAYSRGVKASGKDYGWHWRVHVGLWAASTASRLEGDFVECGVNAGFMSSSIMQYLSWNTLNKTFFLLDTFNGLDERYVSRVEISEGALEKNEKLKEMGFYVTDVSRVIENFSEWCRVKVIQGSIPETLSRVTAEKIAFMHIDLNCAPPEVAAVEYFWDKMVSGAVLLLDDYAYWGYRQQKIAMDELVKRLGAAVLSLPTGQGLLVKP